MIKTFQELTEVDNIVVKLYRTNPTLKDSKFGYAYKRFYQKNYEPTLKELQEKLTDLAVEHALEDKETKALLKDAKGNYEYTKDGKIKLMKAERELLEQTNNKEIEIEPHISPMTPELTEYEFDALNGLVVDRETPRETSKIDQGEEKVSETTNDSTEG